jgi:hypothetical protein
MQHEKSVYYVLETLSGIKREIGALVAAMTENRAALEKHTEKGRPEKARIHYETLRGERERLLSAVRKSRLPLLEIGEETLAARAEKLASSLAVFNLMTRDYGAFAGALSGYAEKLPEHVSANAKIIGRCMNTVRMGHCPTDPENVSYITRAIAFPPGIVTNLLDPCCGEGTALKQIAVGNNCFTYGVEIDEGRAETAQGELHRIGFGSFFHSRISVEAFHFVFLNPPYLSVLTEGGGRTRNEKRFLIESLPHLMPGGLLVYVVPYYRLTDDICRILSDNLAGLSVHRFTDAEFKKFGQVAVMGTRRQRTRDEAAEASLSTVSYSPEKLPSLAEIEEKAYPLPAEARKVAIFRGALFNERELARKLGSSSLFADMIAVKTLSREKRRPPLPFTVGQLGLIGGSGLLNGLIECDEPHIVKGRIVKRTRSEESSNFDTKGKLVSAEITETVSPCMVFGILTPHGFKSLA